MKKLLLYAAAIIIVATSLGYGIDRLQKENLEYRILKSKMETHERTKEDLKKLQHERLTNWVFNHSTKIDLQTARQITALTLDTKHPILILALIEAESEFSPTAISNVGAIGLGQIMFTHHGKDLIKVGIIKNKRDLFSVPNNISAIDFVLSGMLKTNNGDIVRTLHSYLGGRDGKYIARIFHNYVQLHMRELK